MKKNDKNNILSYANESKKFSNNNQLKEIKKSFFINNFDILESLDSNIHSKLNSEKKNIISLNNKTLLSNKKPISLKESYKHKIIKDINFINNKIFLKGKDKDIPTNLKTTRYKSNEIKKMFLINSFYNKKKEDKKNTIPKKFFNIKPLQTDYTNITMTQTIRNQLNKELKYLQKQYHLLDKINYVEENEKKKKVEFNDYADKNVIYNHPQLYYINSNRKGILPRIDYSIKTSCLTESLPDREEIFNKSNLNKFSEYFKIKKSKKPLFIA